MNRNGFLALAAAVLTLFLAADPLGAVTLHFAGSSQLDDGERKVEHYPYWSWGTELEKYMVPGHRVRNCAKSGHSTKSFRESGFWKNLLGGVKPGDFVGIQFGANDQKCNTDFYREKRWAAPNGLFTDIEREWVNEVRAKGATPVLISHSGRCTFDKDGKRIVDWESSPGVTLGSYAEASRRLAKELGCDYVDMQTLVRQLSESLGGDEALKNYVISTGLVLGKDGEPTKDTTHPIKSGAEAQARLFLDEVRRQGLSVAKLFERPERVLRGEVKMKTLRLDGDEVVRLAKDAVVDCESVVAENATNVFLVGEGTVRLAKGGSVTIRNCQGVRLKDFTLHGTDAVPLRILASTDVSVRGVMVTAARGTDSLTLEGSRDVTVEKCRLSRFSAAELRQQAQYALVRDIESADANEPLVRVGIVTDTHIGETRESCGDVARAYRFFKAKGVRMIVNCGDIAHRFFPKGYAHYRAISRETFPDEATAPKELFVWAGHDTMGYPGGREQPPWINTFAEVRRALGIRHDMYSDTVLDGYHFLTVPQQIDVERVRAMLAKACAESAGKPVFVFDHVPTRKTTEGSDTDGNPDRRTIYADYPQVVIVTGHTHSNLRNEQNIWQGEFTTVSGGCFSDWDGGMLGVWRGGTQIRHFLVMDVFADRIVFRRYDLNDGPGEIGAERPWTMPLPFDPATAPFVPSRRRAETACLAFPKGACLTLRAKPESAGGVEVSFPAAASPETISRYRIAVARQTASGECRPWSVQDLPADSVLPPVKRARSFTDVLNGGLFAAGETYRVAVTPLGFFGEAGEPLTAEWQGTAATGTELVWEGVPEEVADGNPVAMTRAKEVRLALPVAIWERVKPQSCVRVVADLDIRQTKDAAITFSLYGKVNGGRYPWQVLTPETSCDLRYAFDAQLPAKKQDYSLAFRRGDGAEIRVRALRIELLKGEM